MKHHRGVSLMELLVVMSACTVIFSLSAVLIGRAMQAESRSRRFMDVERNSWRLTENFRRDVHQAQTATVLDQNLHGGVFLQLSLPEGESIEYSEENGVVRRRLTKEGNQTARESFQFPTYIKLVIHEDFAPRRLELSITADPTTTPKVEGNQPWNNYATRVSLHTVAVIARDSRFSASQSTEGAP